MKQALHFRDYKDIHRGKPIVVIGNGFSLRDVPLDWLNDNITIGMNSFYKREGLNVDYWCLEGAGHLRDEKERNPRLEYMDRAGLVLVNRRFVHHFEHFHNVRSIDYVNDRGEIKKDFSYNPLEQHGSSNSVMFYALQLAFYLGGDPTLIVGMDHRFAEDGEYHFYEEDGIAHVGPHGDFIQWAAKADTSFNLVNNVYKSFRRTILNLTPDTGCDVFPKASLEEWV